MSFFVEGIKYAEWIHFEEDTSERKKSVKETYLFLLDDDETGYDNTDVNLLHMSSIGMRDGHLFMIH